MGYNDSWQVRLARSLSRVRADLSFALVDAILVAVTYTAALVLAFLDTSTDPSRWWGNFLRALPVIVGIHLLSNLVFGAYGHVWEFASVAEAMRLVASNLTSAAILLSGVLALRSFGAGAVLPFMTLALGAVLTLGGMGAIRFRSRMFSFQRDDVDPIRTLVVGTGRSAADLARYAPNLDTPTQVVAFVSEDADHAGPRRLAGAPVVGTVDEIARLLVPLRIKQVVIATSLSKEALSQIVDDCLDVDVRLRILPDIDGALRENGAGRDIRDLEISDLLPRATVSTNLDQVATLLEGKRVLVTGAGGSIGSEVVAQVLKFRPAAVIALDNDETHLFEAAVEWQGAEIKVTPVLCDIRDAGRVLRIFQELQPQVIFHAAAHKHVPILETAPDEAIKTNILGTRHVLDAVRAVQAERFVLISTDKAVEPSSVMGATKRIAEMMTQSATGRYNTVCTAVRFGNVLGSRGSVVPTFMRQIREGGPVTVSNPAMTRYFMTVQEAVELVLQSSALAEGGEIFVLDMGEPVKIMDLAHRMIRLAGLIPGRDIDVKITGTRPGEKLHEVLSRHPLNPSSHPKVQIALPDCPPPATLYETLETLARLADIGSRDELADLVHSLAWQTWDDEETVDLTDLTPTVATVD